MATKMESRLASKTVHGWALKTVIMLAAMMVPKMVSMRVHCLAMKMEINLALKILMDQMLDSLMGKCLY